MIVSNPPMTPMINRGIPTKILISVEIKSRVDDDIFRLIKVFFFYEKCQMKSIYNSKQKRMNLMRC
jgi:hypothetical protein